MAADATATIGPAPERGAKNPDALKRVGRAEGAMLGRTTWMANKHQGGVDTSWHIVDAANVPLGRLAADIALVLMGKHRPEYTPHVDCGDFVVVVNGKQVGITGAKAAQKYKQRYTSYPGGLKTESWGSVRERRPEWLIRDAVRRMLPKNRIGRQMLKKLKVYEGADHPHTSNTPTPMKLRSITHAS